ncbi:BA75_04361T0 [Komagataella pastoris]|uniref:BA75_04361T0 n=1 Tax=Komagataella pastoris TaxID=4922 RepID=A0A1B2JJ59_PICPA|nr:BA75_04361T0 [Komagataella pastoris]
MNEVDLEDIPEYRVLHLSKLILVSVRSTVQYKRVNSQSPERKPLLIKTAKGGKKNPITAKNQSLECMAFVSSEFDDVYDWMLNKSNNLVDRSKKQAATIFIDINSR